ncbi:MAG: hypothetical protein K2Y22_06185 [Candidatus Obscuribacterales bacterium]|nr:hypothetical protein [Candidatus Obscuribacterales bacterium]
MKAKLARMSSYDDYRLSSDTSPETERLLFQLLAQKSPAERLQMVSKSTIMMQSLSLSGLRERYPEDTDVQLKIRLAELLHGKDVARKIADKLMNKQDHE